MQLAHARTRPSMTDSDILRHITTFCLTRGAEGKQINSVARTTKLTWIKNYRALMKEGRQDEALALKPVKSGPKQM